MGSVNSIPNFDADEIDILSKGLRKLDLNKSEGLSFDEIINVPNLKQNTLLHRVFESFEYEGSGEVDVKTLIKGLALFCTKGDRLPKLQFAFRIYDMDNDGFITNCELFQVMKMLIGNIITDIELQQVVNRAILYMDKDEDGKITFEDFCTLINKIGSE